MTTTLRLDVSQNVPFLLPNSGANLYNESELESGPNKLHPSNDVSSLKHTLSAWNV